jgi:hypothetical protein
MNFIDFVSDVSLGFIAVGAVVVTALVGVAKKVGLRSRYAPLVALIFGITIGIVYGGYSTAYNVLLGVLTACSSMGLYSGVKKTVNG